MLMKKEPNKKYNRMAPPAKVEQAGITQHDLSTLASEHPQLGDDTFSHSAKNFRMKRFPQLILFIAIYLIPILGMAMELTGHERVLLFESKITIGEDATVSVKETIQVEVANKKINQGIFRDILTQYSDKKGNKYLAKFKLIDIKKNGKPEHHHTKKIPNGNRIYIGQKGKKLDPGIHTYEIRYELEYALIFFDAFDEFYWNVTGHNWDFIIEKATVLIQIPKGSKILRSSAYTGNIGDTHTNYTSSINKQGMTFETNQPLKPHEGLTVAVALPKGFISEPPSQPQVKLKSNSYRTNIDILINIQENAQAIIKETVQFETTDIKYFNGFFRDYKTLYVNKDRSLTTAELQIISIKKNGKDVPFSTRYHIRNGIIGIHIDNKRNTIKSGIYTYEIVSHLTYAINYHDKFDQFNWKITDGSSYYSTYGYWGTPYEVESISVEIIPPNNANILDAKVFMEHFPKEDKKTYHSKLTDKGIILSTINPLTDDNWFLVSLSWPKGFVLEPPLEEKLIHWAKVNLIDAYSIAFTLAIFLYYICIWLLVGRDAKKGRQEAHLISKPPKGLSPAMIHYIMNKGFRKNSVALSAALINLAIKKCVSIHEAYGGYIIERKPPPPDISLGVGEKTIMKMLFVNGGSINLEPTANAGEVVGRTLKRFNRSVENELSGYYFKSNRMYFIFALIMNLFYLIGLSRLSEDPFTTLFYITCFYILFCVCAEAAISLYRNLTKNTYWQPTLSPSLLSGTAILIGSSLFVTYHLSYFISAIGYTSIFLIILLHLIFYKQLKKYTLSGQKILKEIDGFRLFLESGSSNMKEENPVKMTQDLFEQYLPYAIAMGVENNWAEKFQEELSNSMLSYQPSWCEAGLEMTSFRSSLVGPSIASYIGRGLSSGISQSVSASDSSDSTFSSGSGGEGSSGGGGGGGGGGGW